MRHVRRAFHHESRRTIAARTAAEHGVSVEHLLAVIAARKAFRLAKMYRRRSRKRVLKRNPNAARRPLEGVTYAGEGELHALLREANLTRGEFFSLAGISKTTFDDWYGHPLHRMPIALLEHYIWAHNMAAALAARGIDPTQFRPKGMPAANRGRYPRSAAQVEKVRHDARQIANASTINCPVHGEQQAMGGECPKC